MSKFVVQLISLDDGTRSEPFAIVKEHLDQSLEAIQIYCETQQEENGKKIGIVVVWEGTKDDMKISQAPVMNIETFCRVMTNAMKGVKENA